MELYGSLAWCFDLITTGEDHETEADFIRTAVKTHKRSDGNDSWTLAAVTAGTTTS